MLGKIWLLSCRDIQKHLATTGSGFLALLASRGSASYSEQAALRALFNGVPRQRCQLHLQQNAQAYVPKKTMKKQVSDDIADIFAAPNGKIARARLKQYVEKYAESAPELSEWMEENLPEGLTVFELPAEHRKRMRTTNSLERLHEEINRRTRVGRIATLAKRYATTEPKSP